MKPSEYCKSKNCLLVYIDKPLMNNINELDSRFIDKEKLKEKINLKLFNYQGKVNTYEKDTQFKYQHLVKPTKQKIEIYKEILKLLEE